jgi:hypothetical protein
MAENKTVPTVVTYEQFRDSVEPARHEECDALVKLMSAITGEPPVMWGGAIIGFGKYHYQYQSGHSGDSFRIGFSPRKAQLSLYVVSGFEGLTEPLSRLGKHSLGKSCLYIKRLRDVNMAALEDLLRLGWQTLPSSATSA